MERYRIKLTKEEVEDLRAVIKKGSRSTQAFRSAYVLLNCDEGEYADKVSNETISKVLKIGMRTIDRIKMRLVEEGLEGVLESKTNRRIYDVKLDGEVEAKLVQLCCSELPAGYAKWSLRLLADKMVEMEYVPSISYVSARSMLKKMKLSLGK
jgi:transposase